MPLRTVTCSGRALLPPRRGRHGLCPGLHAADATIALTACTLASDTLRQYGAGTSAEDAARADTVFLRFDEQPIGSYHHFHSRHGPRHVSDVSFTTITDASGHTTPVDTPERLTYALFVASVALTTHFQQRANDHYSQDQLLHTLDATISADAAADMAVPFASRRPLRSVTRARAGWHPG